MTQGVKDGMTVSMSITKIELNPTVDMAEFVMPAETADNTESENSTSK